MVIDDGNIVGSAVGPYEYDTPLSVDADRMVIFVVALEFFQVIAFRQAEDPR